MVLCCKQDWITLLHLHVQVGSGEASTNIFVDGISIGSTTRRWYYSIDAFKSNTIFNGVGIGTTNPFVPADFSMIGAHSIDDEKSS